MHVEFPPHAVGEFIGGIDEDKIEAGRFRRDGAVGEPAHDVGPHQLGPLAQPELLHVAERRAGVAVDQDDAVRPA